MSEKILIAYFSHKGKNYYDGNIDDLPVGNTEAAAKIIEKITEGDLFLITPTIKYSQDYSTCTEEAKAELRRDARPELTLYPENIDEYETIILAYPNWWGTMPMPVWTFLERYDFSGKTIFPLCTHEGSGIGRSEADIKKLSPTATLKKGLAIRGGRVKNAEKEIAAWLKT